MTTATADSSESDNSITLTRRRREAIRPADLNRDQDQTEAYVRYYFFGDIHGNDYALNRCLEHVEEVEAEKVFCLGDIVGWLPFGDRTLRAMRSSGIPTVAGNHDLLVAGLFADRPDQIDRKQASAYNAGVLSTVPEATDYLLDLPLIVDEKDFVVVHHSPFLLPDSANAPTIECFDYLNRDALTRSLVSWGSFPKRIIMSGHDHLPAIYELPESQDSPGIEDVIAHRPGPSEPLVIRIKPSSRYWVKTGSVGGPYRDGIAVCNSALYDSTEQTLTLFRLPYPTRDLLQELIANRFCRHVPTLKRYVELLASASHCGE